MVLARRVPPQLLTLGILSLVMLMAMSFAFSARTTRHVAKVNADLTAAVAAIARPALDRAVGLMDYMLDKLDEIGNNLTDPIRPRYILPVATLRRLLSAEEGVKLYASVSNFSAHKFAYQPGIGNPYVTRRHVGIHQRGNDGTPQKDR